MGYKHMSIKERESILEFLSRGESQESIAKRLKRDKSSISREIKRNIKDSKYSPNGANEMYKERKSKCGRKYSLSNSSELRESIKNMLTEDLSPEQIEGRLKLENKDTVCFKTIYRGIKSGIFQLEAKEVLRRKGKSKAHGSQEKRGTIPDRTMIDERPAAAETRTEIGHFESDTMVGSGKKGAIATFVDRKSRYLQAEIMADRTSATMNFITISIFKNMPDKTLKTLTSDNGKEFSGFKEIEEQLGVKNYFAHPYHSWERGTNENTNGLIRQYFPKGTDFTKITSQDINAVVDKINNRPRTVLGFRTPNEVFWGEIQSCT
jgi:IS30 family transposase